MFLIVASIMLFSIGIAANNAFADKVVGTIPLGYYPFDNDVNSITNRLYVTTYNHVTYNTSFAFVIDGSTNSVIAKLWAGYDHSFAGVAVNPKTNRIYAADSPYDRIVVINGVTNAFTSTITGIPTPGLLAVNPSTNKIYVQSNNLDIFVIDGATNTVIKGFAACGIYPSGVQPNGSILPIDVAVNPVTNMAYVTCIKMVKVAGGHYENEASWVAVIDGSTDTVIKNVTLGGSTWPSGVRVNSNTNRIYVGGSPSAFVIDGNTNLVIATISSGCGCAGRIGINQNTNKVYFSDGNHSITIVDGARNTVIGSVPVGDTFTAGRVSSVSVNPVTNKIYVGNSESRTVSVIQGINPTKTTISPNPSSVAIGGTITFTGMATDTYSGTKTTPKGTLTWTDGGAGGKFTVNGIATNTCTLSSVSSTASSCKITYTPPSTSTVGTVVTITAKYAGDGAHKSSFGTSKLTVLRATSSGISPGSASVVHGGKQLYTVIVTDTTSSGTKSAPTGTVSWKASVSGGSFSSISCTLVSISSSQSRCQVTYTAPSTASTITITATYNGDSLHVKSSGRTTLSVT